MQPVEAGPVVGGISEDLMQNALSYLSIADFTLDGGLLFSNDEVTEGIDGKVADIEGTDSSETNQDKTKIKGLKQVLQFTSNANGEELPTIMIQHCQTSTSLFKDISPTKTAMPRTAAPPSL